MASLPPSLHPLLIVVPVVAQRAWQSRAGRRRALGQALRLHGGRRYSQSTGMCVSAASHDSYYIIYNALTFNGPFPLGVKLAISVFSGPIKHLQ